MLNEKYLLSNEKEDSLEDINNPQVGSSYILSLLETISVNYPERRNFFYDAPEVIEKFPKFIKTESFLFLNIALFEKALEDVKDDKFFSNKYGVSSTALFQKFNPVFESLLNSDNNFTDKELIKFLDEVGYKDSSKRLKEIGEKGIFQEKNLITLFQENEIKNFLNRFPQTYKEATNNNFDYVVNFGKKLSEVTQDMSDSALGFLLKQISSEKLKPMCINVKQDYESDKKSEQIIEQISVNLLKSLNSPAMYSQRHIMAITSLTSLSSYKSSEKMNEKDESETTDKITHLRGKPTTVKKAKIK